MHKILFVDDEPKITEAYKEAFARNYNVGCANDGENAIRSIQENKPDLIVLDWRLKSDIEGRDVLLFAKRECPSIPVYIVTASIQSVKEIRSLGADECLTKPCGDLLRERVKSLLPPQ